MVKYRPALTSAIYILTVVLILSLPGKTVTAQVGSAGQAEFYGAVWSPDGTQIAASGTFGIALYSANFQLRKLLVSTPTSQLLWSPNGKQLAGTDVVTDSEMNTTNSVVNVWDVNSSRLMATLKVLEGSITSISWSSDSQRLTVSSYDEVVYVWDIRSSQVVFKLTSPSPITDAAWSPNGLLIAAVGGGQTTVPQSDPMINVWNARTGQLKFSINTSDLDGFNTIDALAWSPDSTKIALAVGPSEDGSDPIVDIASQTIQKGLEWHVDEVNLITWGHKGRKIASAAGGVEGSLAIWDAATKDVLFQLQRPDFYINFGYVAWSPDDSQLAVLLFSQSNGFHSQLTIVDGNAGTLLAVMEPPSAEESFVF